MPVSTPDAPSSSFRDAGWTVARLKQELVRRQLSAQGTKQILLERLEQDEAEQSKREPLLMKLKGTSTAANSPSSAFANWTLQQLQAELRIRRLPTSGNKAALVQRLEREQEMDRASSSESDAALSTSALAQRARGSRVNMGVAASASKATRILDAGADAELLNYEGTHYFISLELSVGFYI
jgi:hypothetical protein